MGGKAVPTDGMRKTPEDYVAYKDAVMTILVDEMGLDCVPVRELPEKADFGDLDIIVVADARPSDADIRAAFGADTPICVSGDVVSFAWRGFQTDLMMCKRPELRDMHRLFNDYSDVGGILGRMTKAKGIKFGMNGLEIVLLRDTVENNTTGNRFETLQWSASSNPDDRTFKSCHIHLSSDVDKIGEFLAMDMDVWRRGFQTQEEVMAWLRTCRFFSPRTFHSGRVNYEHKKRIAKRPFYGKFVAAVRAMDTDADADIPEKMASNVNEIAENRQFEAIEFFGKTRVIVN